MARFRLDSIAGLARQMSFTPHDTLALQLSAAEELLHGLDPGKAYPLDFVIYRITGYHPKRVSDDLLTGLALQHDLGLLIERVSGSLGLSTAKLSEPVLDIDDLTERCNVTSKTIQRWRRRGLPARRILFPDGKRRVGFLLSSVERFFAAHRDQVSRQTNVSLVGDPERETILRKARILAGPCGCCAAEVSRRIARKLDRSPLTVLHTIRKHDQEHPRQAILQVADAPVGDEDRARILRAYRHGASIKSLAKKHGRGRAAIYRVIMDERIARLNRRKIKFVDDPLYHQPNAAVAVEEIAAQEELGNSAGREELRAPRDLPAYLQDLYRTPLLTAPRERALFLKFNFHKFQFVQARRKLEPQFAKARDLSELEKLLRRVVEAKNAIVAANLRLVVSVARKHLRPGLNLMELVSDGNLTLMRAVESFDLHKGYRFSTYATFGLMKGFARSVPLMWAWPHVGAGDAAMLGELPDSRVHPAAERLFHRDEVRQLLSRLDDRERRVLLAHYGLADGSLPATFEEVGRRLGLSKQQARHIEQGAIAKIRASLSPS